MSEVKQPRVLVISNNCLSLGNSNGRTLFNLLSSLPSSNIANFYVRDEVSDISQLSNFFRVTDQQAFRAWKTHQPADGIIPNLKDSNSQNGKPAKDHKNPLFSIARDIIWNSNAWQSPSLQLWLNHFSPSVIILQAGDAPFLFRLARRLATKRNIPLIIYNSEDYCFKKYNYMSHRFGVFYPLFHMRLLRQVRKAIRVAHTCIYNSEQLKQEYEHHFAHHAEVIMMAATNEPAKTARVIPSNKPLHCVYLGNLSVGRHHSLIEIATILHQHNLVLDVYGPGSPEIIAELNKVSGIIYHGVIAYEATQKVMMESDLLVHAESFGAYAIKDLRFAFSTKIADSLASGIPFFLYAPKELVCSQYLLPLIPAFVATSKEELPQKLNAFLTGQSSYPWQEKILPFVNNNHAIRKNQQKLAAIIDDALNKEVRL